VDGKTGAALRDIRDLATADRHAGETGADRDQSRRSANPETLPIPFLRCCTRSGNLHGGTGHSLLPVFDEVSLARINFSEINVFIQILAIVERQVFGKKGRFAKRSWPDLVQVRPGHHYVDISGWWCCRGG